MKAKQLIEIVNKVISADADADVSLEVVGGDRYGDEIALKVGGTIVLKKYFGSEMPMW